jgi:hypothetical protein
VPRCGWLSINLRSSQHMDCSIIDHSGVLHARFWRIKLLYAQCLSRLFTSRARIGASRFLFLENRIAFRLWTNSPAYIALIA